MELSSDFQELQNKITEYAENVRKIRIQRILRILNNENNKDTRLKNIYSRMHALLTAISIAADELNEVLEEAEALLDL